MERSRNIPGSHTVSNNRTWQKWLQTTSLYPNIKICLWLNLPPNAHNHFNTTRLEGTEGKLGWKRDSGLNHLWWNTPVLQILLQPITMWTRYQGPFWALKGTCPSEEPWSLRSLTSWQIGLSLPQSQHLPSPHPRSPGLLPSLPLSSLPLSVCS